MSCPGGSTVGLRQLSRGKPRDPMGRLDRPLLPAPLPSGSGETKSSRLSGVKQPRELASTQTPPEAQLRARALPSLTWPHAPP